MANEAELKVIISAKDEASKVFDDIQGKIKGMQPAFKQMALWGSVAFAAITGEAVKAIEAFSEEQSKMTTVNAILETLSVTIKKSGMTMDEAKKKTADWGLAMMKLSGFSDEGLSDSLARLWQITKSYTEAQKLATLAANLAVYKNIDLETSTDLLMKVYAGNLGMLSRYGIVLEEGATKTEAFARITELAGNQIEKHQNDIVVKNKVLKESFENLQSAIGATLSTALAPYLDKATAILEKVQKWIEAHPELTKQIIIVTAVVSGLVGGLGLLGMAIGGVITAFILLTSPIGLVVLAIMAVVAVATLVILNWTKVKEFLINAWNSIKEFATSVWKAISDTIMSFVNPIIDTIKDFLNFVDKAINAAKSVGSYVGSTVKKIGKAFDFSDILFPNYDTGGMVNAPLGTPVPAIVHGGEEVLTPAQQRVGRGGITVNINGGTYLSEDVAEKIGDLIIGKLKLQLRF